jgi:hypothetical protein
MRVSNFWFEKVARSMREQFPGGTAINGDWPSVLPALRSLQATHAPKECRPQPGDRIGFALSSKDRLAYTLRTIQALDAEGEFDLIWNDGSDRAEVPDLSRYFEFRKARLVETNYGVRGGPDAAICFGLRRLIELGYDYVGLIENDVVLRPGWFQTLLSLFDLAAAEGVVVGAASVLGYKSRVLEYRRGYSIDWARGAAMALFSRPAAELLVERYSTLKLSNCEIRGFYAQRFGVALHVPEWCVGSQWMDGPLSMDWSYAPLLYQHGYACVGSVPSMAFDLEFDAQKVMRTDYVGLPQNGAGLAHPGIALPVENGEFAMAAARASASRPAFTLRSPVA